jgi:hypothetical protein
MLEWYEAYADYDDLARRCEPLVAPVAQAAGSRSTSLRPGRRHALADAIGVRVNVDIIATRELIDLDDQRALFEPPRLCAAEGNKEARRWTRRSLHTLGPGCRRPAGSGSTSTAW